MWLRTLWIKSRETWSTVPHFQQVLTCGMSHTELAINIFFFLFYTYKHRAYKSPINFHASLSYLFILESRTNLKFHNINSLFLSFLNPKMWFINLTCSQCSIFQVHEIYCFNRVFIVITKSKFVISDSINLADDQLKCMTELLVWRFMFHSCDRQFVDCNMSCCLHYMQNGIVDIKDHFLYWLCSKTLPSFRYKFILFIFPMNFMIFLFIAQSFLKKSLKTRKEFIQETWMLQPSKTTWNAFLMKFHQIQLTEFYVCLFYDFSLFSNSEGNCMRCACDPKKK